MFTTFVTTTITGKSNIGTADETDIHLHVFQKMQKRGWTNVAEMDKNFGSPETRPWGPRRPRA